jgi:hypothetical protein
LRGAENLGADRIHSGQREVKSGVPGRQSRLGCLEKPAEMDGNTLIEA